MGDLLADLRAKNLVWGAAGLPVDFRGDEARFTDGLRQLPETAAALRRAGVTRVATWLSPASSTLTYLANFRQHARRLREAAKVLGDHGQRFGLEYVGPKTSWTAAKHPFIHTMAEMKELIAEIGQPNVGFLLDSWHWYTAGETEADLLALTNQDVVACHLNDAPAGIAVDEQRDGTRALPAATGVIDLATFLGALVRIGYDGPVRGEPFDKSLNALSDEEALAATAAAMKKAFAFVE
jgi:sugar phosphate isomerase/epimerase